MKRVFLYLIFATTLWLCRSCEKTPGSQNGGYDLANRVIPMSTDSKDATYLLTTKVGHLSTVCGGSCITVNGKNYHVDCMGYGHVCLQYTTVSLNQSGTDITATTTDTFGLTSGDFFLMPDRSLNYTDENNNRIFLNIPEQLLFRDSTTQQFTFTGLFFSDGPAYDNN